MLVTAHLADRLLGPKRLAALLHSLAEKRSASDAEVEERAAILQTEVTQADDKLRRLYKMVEDGITDLDGVLRDRLAALESSRERAKEALDRVKGQLAPQLALAPEQIEQFGVFMREKITEGDTTPAAVGAPPNPRRPRGAAAPVTSLRHSKVIQLCF
ncbi:MAG: hypothetical protein L0Y57_08275, partial [Beijerinckiaceae bacterium]|nr:hypothetical protein [Beijerinckiaceae bacterium]